MSEPEQTSVEYDSLIKKIALLEEEVREARKWPKVMVVALVLVCLLVVGAWGQGGVSVFCDGITYLKTFDDHAKVGYVAGVSDAVRLIAKKPINTKLFNKRIEGMPPGQVQAIVAKYMKDNPRDWHLAMADIVYEAVVSDGVK